jgi:signal transduction histidine kinase
MGAVDVLETFAEVLSHVDSEGSADDFYGKLCEATCRMAGMDRAVIFRYDESRRRVRAVGAHGLDLAMFEGANVSVESAPIARLALEEDRVVEAPAGDAQAVPAEYLDLVRGSQLVCSPMAAGGEWVGVILCDRGAGGARLAGGERHLLWTLGKVAALATRARLATFNQQQAQRLRDRVDLARDVHDSVVQRLFGVSLALAADAPLDPEARERAATEVQEALAELRSLLGRPLDDAAPAPAATLAEEARRLGVVFETEPVAPPEREALAQNVLSEAARNARKHADPSRIEGRTDDVDGTWTMEIRNDGVSGRPRHLPGMGLRLAALEALQVGGLIEFGPAEDGWWHVRLTVPT